MRQCRGLDLGRSWIHAGERSLPTQLWQYLRVESISSAKTRESVPASRFAAYRSRSFLGAPLRSSHGDVKLGKGGDKQGSCGESIRKGCDQKYLPPMAGQEAGDGKKRGKREDDGSSGDSGRGVAIAQSDKQANPTATDKRKEGTQLGLERITEGDHQGDERNHA